MITWRRFLPGRLITRLARNWSAESVCPFLPITRPGVLALDLEPDLLGRILLVVLEEVDGAVHAHRGEHIDHEVERDIGAPVLLELGSRGQRPAPRHRRPPRRLPFGSFTIHGHVLFPFQEQAPTCRRRPESSSSRIGLRARDLRTLMPPARSVFAFEVALDEHLLPDAEPGVGQHVHAEARREEQHHHGEDAGHHVQHHLLLRRVALQRHEPLLDEARARRGPWG